MSAATRKKKVAAAFMLLFAFSIAIGIIERQEDTFWANPYYNLGQWSTVAIFVFIAIYLLGGFDYLKGIRNTFDGKK